MNAVVPAQAALQCESPWSSKSLRAQRPAPGRRRRIIAREGSTIVPINERQLDGTLVKALVRARRWTQLLDARVYTSVSEIAKAEGINKSYASRILRFALLTRGIVEVSLERRTKG